jgi:16S rRNA (cytosine1402-N4)-methyltransferase
MHKPVLLEEVVELMRIRPGGRYIDGTLGSAGHAKAILERAGANGELLGIDRDADALARAAENLSAWGARALLEHGDFADMSIIAKRRGMEGVDGVLLDLGMSSDQVDTPDRGFSFLHDGPLDMRMDRSQAATAADLVNHSGEQELANLLWKLGEESASRRVAKFIVAERERSPITTTGRLAEVVARAKGVRGRIHPATKTFQALRLAVNHELESLESGLESALDLVKPGGRVAVISFHSLEDRIVKQVFSAHVGRWESLAAGGQEWVGRRPIAEWVTRKLVTASEHEMADNPRSRSAKLRVVERQA